METRNDIFKTHLQKYLKATKTQKSQLLDSICEVSNLHRKAAIRKFKRLQKQSSSAPAPKRGRPVVYGPDVNAALKQVWEAASEICGELLYPLIAEYVTIFQRDGMWNHSKEATAKLLSISEGAVKSRVGKFAKASGIHRGKSGTKPSQLKEIIPIFSGPWSDKPPGYGQIDTVAHCGSSLAGNFVWTVNWTDVATLWGARRAQWNKGQRATLESVATIQESLPFALLGIHPDTGGEFITWLLQGWCEDRGIEMTRSRPNHKNDNAYVEQKNGHVVRRFLGYTRYDCKDTVEVMNGLYAVLDVYLNHFVTSRKTLEKVRIGSKYKRRYDKAQTPYARVLADPTIDQKVKDKLKSEHQKLNPLLLKKQVDTLINRILTIQRDYSNRK